MDYYESAEDTAKKLCMKYRRINRELAEIAAFEAADIYENSRAVRNKWDFECWVISRIWQQYLISRQFARNQEDNGMAKVSEKEKNEIRQKYLQGDKVSQIAKEYGVSEPVVYNTCSDLKFERNQVIELQQSKKAPAGTAEDTPAAGGAEAPVEEAPDKPAEKEEPVVKISPYNLANGFESFCRGNMLEDFKASIYRVGEMIEVTVEVGSRKVVLTDAGNGNE